MPVAVTEFLAGMRRLAAGVTIVATGAPGHRSGLTATAVCSVSADPPQLLVCVNRTAQAHDRIPLHGSFTVNVLAEHQQEFAQRFAGRTGHEGEDKFAAGGWDVMTTGAPALNDTCASFDCRLAQSIDAGTHTIYIGLVEAVRANPEHQAMLYLDGKFGRIAPLG